jgi:hypothetical protein
MLQIAKIDTFLIRRQEGERGREGKSFISLLMANVSGIEITSANGIKVFWLRGSRLTGNGWWKW